MAKISRKRLKGSQYMRLRLLLATLSATPITIDDIRPHDMPPGLRKYEISLIRLLDTISDGSVVEINDAGTKLNYKPGTLIGGRHLVHECHISRSIGYYLEPLIILGLFGQKPLCIRLKGITNDSRDLSVDTFRSTTLHLLERFGVPSEGLDLKIECRGSPPLGGGEVVLKVPVVQNSLQAVRWTDVGLVKRIRGTTFTTLVSCQKENTMIHSARGIFNLLLPDVHIFTDHKAGVQAGKSPGYGISLVAETTTKCFISTDSAIKHAQGEHEYEYEDEEKKEPTPPEVLGEDVASVLLGEIEQGGVVDSAHQGLLFTLCSICPPDVCKVRVGKLTPYAIQTLRHIKDFLGVTFAIEPDSSTGTVILKCSGMGYKNLSRTIS